MLYSKHLIHLMTLWGNICHPYFIDEEIESQRGCLLTKDTQLVKRRACIQIQAVWSRVRILISALKRLFRAWWHEVSECHGIPRGAWFPVGHYFTLVPSCPIRKVLDHRDKVYEQLSKYLQLRNVIERLQEAKHSELYMQVDLGCNFFVDTVVPDTSRIYMALGYGFFLELTLAEALKFIDRKSNLLTE